MQQHFDCQRKRRRHEFKISLHWYDAALHHDMTSSIQAEHLLPSSPLAGVCLGSKRLRHEKGEQERSIAVDLDGSGVRLRSQSVQWIHKVRSQKSCGSTHPSAVTTTSYLDFTPRDSFIRSSSRITAVKFLSCNPRNSV